MAQKDINEAVLAVLAELVTNAAKTGTGRQELQRLRGLVEGDK